MLIKEKISQTLGLGSTVALMREGYLFIKNRADAYKTDLFITWLMRQEVVCMSGEEAARLIYDSEKFHRHGAAPKQVQETLFGVKAVQTMDDQEHLHRKHLSMSCVQS